MKLQRGVAPTAESVRSHVGLPAIGQKQNPNPAIAEEQFSGSSSVAATIQTFRLRPTIGRLKGNQTSALQPTPPDWTLEADALANTIRGSCGVCIGS